MPTGRRILVVEGDEALRSLLVRALSGDGYEVIAVPPGAAEDPSAPYDLIVTGEHDVPSTDVAEPDRQAKDAHPTRPTLHLDELSRGDLAYPGQPLGYRPFSVDLLLDRVRRRLNELEAQ